MYILFKHHGILPGQFYAMPLGEKLLLRAFVDDILLKGGYLYGSGRY